MKIFISVIFLLLPLLAQAQVPACNRVSGTGAITFTTDKGKTLATTEPLKGLTYTFGLVTLEKPSALLAVVNRKLLGSDDGGCLWKELAEFEENSEYMPLKLVASRGERAYGWADNRRYMVRIDAGRVTYLKPPANPVLGVLADPVDADRVYIGGSNGIFESRDGGLNWEQTAQLPLPSEGLILYRVAFDPSDPKHILIGTAKHGAYVSRDGGKNWEQSAGIAATANVFEFAVSPVKGSRVWAMGLDTEQTGRSNRHIYLSRDGGETFSPVIDDTGEVTLRNQPLMVAHPRKADTLYFVFGTFFQDYGTDLFHYSYSTKRISRTHNAHHDINSIAFSRAKSSVMYLGLQHIE